MTELFTEQQLEAYCPLAHKLEKVRLKLNEALKTFFSFPI